MIPRTVERADEPVAKEREINDDRGLETDEKGPTETMGPMTITAEEAAGNAAGKDEVKAAEEIVEETAEKTVEEAVIETAEEIVERAKEKAAERTR